jgi:hypothetical protein
MRVRAIALAIIAHPAAVLRIDHAMSKSASEALGVVDVVFAEER